VNLFYRGKKDFFCSSSTIAGEDLSIARLQRKDAGAITRERGGTKFRRQEDSPPTHPTSLITLLQSPSPSINLNCRNPKSIQSTMEAFEYNAAPARVIFGSGTLSKLSAEVARLNVSAPLLLSTPQQVDQATHLKTILDGKVAGIFTEATMQTPTHIPEKALEYAKSVKADAVISIGGGSTIGLGKAISIRTGLPHICIPTTYAGSEMTPILGETQDGKKTTRSDPKILPGTVIYDVDLTMTLPASMSATSGVNAIAHAGK
jgi:hypothetical protein